MGTRPRRALLPSHKRIPAAYRGADRDVLEEPTSILKLSAGMARRGAFPIDAVETEEIGTCVVEDAIATSTASLPATASRRSAGRGSSPIQPTQLQR